MLKGFKDFLLRGNVIELAVGVAIGAAFTALVKSFNDYVINPLINSFGSAGDIQGVGIELGEPCPADATDCASTFLDIGALIGAFITFFLTALVIYFAIVVPYTKAKALGAKKGEEAKEAEEPEFVAEDIALLREIRDALVKDAPPAGTAKSPEA